MDFKQLIKQLEQGICPAELCFNATATEELDWHQVAYNTKYNTAHFFENKFPDELHGIPGFNKVIDLCVEKNINNTPLKEIEQRQIVTLEIEEEDDDIDSTIHGK